MAERHVSPAASRIPARPRSDLACVNGGVIPLAFTLTDWRNLSGDLKVASVINMTVEITVSGHSINQLYKLYTHHDTSLYQKTNIQDLCRPLRRAPSDRNGKYLPLHCNTESYEQ